MKIAQVEGSAYPFNKWFLSREGVKACYLPVVIKINDHQRALSAVGKDEGVVGSVLHRLFFLLRLRT